MVSSGPISSGANTCIYVTRVVKKVRQRRMHYIIHGLRLLFELQDSFFKTSVFIAGFLAVVVSCCSMRSAEMDWEGARTRGKIALWLSIAGVVTTVIGVLAYVLVFFTRDS